MIIAEIFLDAVPFGSTETMRDSRIFFFKITQYNADTYNGGM